MSKKHKKIKQEQELARQQKEELIANVLKFSKKRFKKFDEVIVQLYKCEDLSSFFSDRRIWKVHDCFKKTSSGANSHDRGILKNVFLHLHRESTLLSGEHYIQVVFNMVQFRNSWCRDIYEWKPSSGRAATQVNELAYYLFCHYPVPRFLYSAFYEQTNLLFINWFIQVGSGKKVKDLCRVPINFTQRMAHYFLQAPSKFSIPEALRWTQVKGMNGDDKLAERIAYSWIGSKPYEDEEFWETFIRVLVNGGMFNYDHLTELIDYVRESRTANRNYSLKGRTLQSLLRQSDEWHRRSILIKGVKTWSACGLKGYKLERKEEMILMEELTGSKLLSDEGRRMKHCVASYVHYCVAGRTAIFSLRRYSMGIFTETLATIEVNLAAKRVVQAKARMNARISDESMKHLTRWAGENELTLSPYL